MSTEQINDNDKLFAALSYVIWPVAVIVLLSESNKKRPFQRYHAVQALGFAVAAFAVYAAFGCIYSVIILVANAIADILGTLVACIWVPIWLIPVGLALWFAYRAYQGELFEIPYVTDFVRSQGWL